MPKPTTVGHLPLLAFCALLAAMPAFGQTTWHVSASATAAPPTGTASAPFGTIQAALGAAANGDLILVGPGNYTENVDFLGKDVVVRSVAGKALTAIFGAGLSCVRFVSGEPASATLDGFSLVSGTALDGGGILCVNSAARVTRCSIAGCTATNDGGGVHVFNGQLALADCEIQSNNSGIKGGGITSVFGATVTLERCVVFGNGTGGRGGGIATDQGVVAVADSRIEGNTAMGDGGGVSLATAATGVAGTSTIVRSIIRENVGDFGGGLEAGSGTLRLATTELLVNTARFSGGGVSLGPATGSMTSCLLSRNEAAGFGGGLYVTASTVAVNGCTVADNTAATGAGVHVFTSAPPVTNSVLWGNAPDQFTAQPGATASVTFSNVQGGATGAGNFDAAPLFLDPVNFDYRIAASSPCVDAGSTAPPGTDLEGHPRVSGASMDAGADEYVPLLAGTGDDLELMIAIDGRPQTVHTVPLGPGETLSLTLRSPSGTLATAIPLIVASTFNTAAPPPTPVSGVHVDFSTLVILLDGSAPTTPFFLGILGSHGVSLTLPSLGIAPGVSVRIQGAALSALTANSQYGTTPALDLVSP